MAPSTLLSSKESILDQAPSRTINFCAGNGHGCVTLRSDKVLLCRSSSVRKRAAIVKEFLHCPVREGPLEKGIAGTPDPCPYNSGARKWPQFWNLKKRHYSRLFSEPFAGGAM